MGQFYMENLKKKITKYKANIGNIVIVWIMSYDITEQEKKASRCFLPSTLSLSLASEQTLKDLKRSQGHQRGGEETGFDYRGPPDFTETHHRG